MACLTLTADRLAATRCRSGPDHGSAHMDASFMHTYLQLAPVHGYAKRLVQRSSHAVPAVCQLHQPRQHPCCWSHAAQPCIATLINAVPLPAPETSAAATFGLCMHGQHTWRQGSTARHCLLPSALAADIKHAGEGHPAGACEVTCCCLGRQYRADTQDHGLVSRHVLFQYALHGRVLLAVDFTLIPACIFVPVSVAHASPARQQACPTCHCAANSTIKGRFIDAVPLLYAVAWPTPDVDMQQQCQPCSQLGACLYLS